VILFTYAALLPYTANAPGSSGLLHKVGQLQQVLVAKQTPSCGQYHEWICWQHCCPARRNRAQCAAAVVEVNSILAPVVAVSDQLEALASQRMVGMGDFKSTFGTVGIRCSRRTSPIRMRSAGYER